MFRLSDVFTLTLVRATIRMSTPILLAALGVIVTELAAITNVGIEGIMLVSAFMRGPTTTLAVGFWVFWPRWWRGCSLPASWP